jgi:hypothetical protein
MSPLQGSIEIVVWRCPGALPLAITFHAVGVMKIFCLCGCEDTALPTSLLWFLDLGRDFLFLRSIRQQRQGIDRSGCRVDSEV